MAVKSVRAVANALDVIEALAEQPGSGVSALARQLGLDKMAVQRILVTLFEAGWVRSPNGESGRWELSPRLAALGRGIATDLRNYARQHLEQLAQDTGETVLLWAIEGQRAVVVDSVDSDQALRMSVPVGTNVPIHGPLAPYFGHDGELPDYYIMEDEYPNAVAVGVPVFRLDDVPTAAITVVGPRSRLPKSRLDTIGRALVRVSHVLEATP